MSSAMPFTFNAVNLYVVTINSKPWTSAKKACKTLQCHARTSKTANIIKAHGNPENITQKYKICSVRAACTPTNWSADLPDTIFTSMRKACTNCFLEVRSLRQRHLESIVLI